MISILPIGDVYQDDLGELAAGLQRFLKADVRVLSPEPLPTDQVSRPVRELEMGRSGGAGELQYHVNPFLALARETARSDPDSNRKILAVTDVDLYTEGLNFIFGQAEISGSAAVVATPRLKYHKYWSFLRKSLEPRKVYTDRLLKEAVHELGHTFGLRHCRDRKCVMTFSNSLEDTDFKGTEYCGNCIKKLI